MSGEEEEEEEVVLSYLGKVVLAVVAVATARLHQASGGHSICVDGGDNADAAVALLHDYTEQHAGVDAVGPGNAGDGDADAVHWKTFMSDAFVCLDLKSG